MSRVITFSRHFPGYHPKAGQPTHFVEKILNCLDTKVFTMEQLMATPLIDHRLVDMEIYDSCVPKSHTVRAGHRWKSGDMASFRVWGNDVNPKSGRSGPYHSKQITIAPDVEIVKVWDIEIKRGTKTGGCIYMDGKLFAAIDLTYPNTDNHHWDNVKRLAANDGLTGMDLLKWFKFPSPMQGQIICWDSTIEY